MAILLGDTRHLRTNGFKDFGRSQAWYKKPKAQPVVGNWLQDERAGTSFSLDETFAFEILQRLRYRRTGNPKLSHEFRIGRDSIPRLEGARMDPLANRLHDEASLIGGNGHCA